MIQEGDVIITGVSGGADSICLLFVLWKLQREMEFGLVAVHVNHCLRGDEADRDEAFVREFCEKRGIPFFLRRRDVADYARRNRLSEEEAGREVRRAAYLEAADNYGGTKIALAHHMDDNAETVLLNLARGTGLKGMGGIRPAAGMYIRPLLAVRRREIEAFLEAEKLDFCTDATNREDLYARNRIRNHVMPYLEKEINCRAVEHIQETAAQMEALEDYVCRQTDALWDSCVSREGEHYLLDTGALGKGEKVLRTRLIYKLLAKAAGREKDIEAVHIKMVEDLAGKQTGRGIDLPYGLCAVRRYQNIWIGKREDCLGKKTENSEIFLCSGGEAEFAERICGGVRVRLLKRGEIPDTIENRPYTKWFDYDIIKNSVVLRSRRPGDFLDIDGQGRTQKLKKYFINAKIPQEMRDKVLLVAEGPQILWIVGFRQNQKYQVTEDTKRILEIRMMDYGG